MTVLCGAVSGDVRVAGSVKCRSDDRDVRVSPPSRPPQFYGVGGLMNGGLVPIRFVWRGLDVGLGELGAVAVVDFGPGCIHKPPFDG